MESCTHVDGKHTEAAAAALTSDEETMRPRGIAKEQQRTPAPAGGLPVVVAASFVTATHRQQASSGERRNQHQT